MKKLSVLLILCTVSLFFLQNCKDKDSVKPNPCADKQIPLGDIILAEKPGLFADWYKGEKEFFEVDKINDYLTLHMIGPPGYKSYRWSIGSMIDYSTKQNAVINFDKPEGLLKVRLIATRTPMTDCFPNDDGVDTFVKSIDVIKNWNGNQANSPITGTWKGNSTQFGDTLYEVSFYYDTIKKATYIKNLLRTNCFDDDISLGYIVWAGQGRKTDCVFDFIAQTFVDNKDSIVIDYRVEGPSPQYLWTRYRFTGKRN
ncbi:MAG: hypothetical protein F9K23_16260 [Bacteroidetes bacterium]|nr:MAG: hypothetical protein F9K23_16260 [Bacteroidota bacterium]